MVKKLLWKSNTQELIGVLILIWIHSLELLIVNQTAQFNILLIVLGVPRGLYLHDLIETTRIELHWECDYLREARY